MKIAIIAASVLALSACASSSQLYTQDGRVGYSINCNGSANTWGSCATKAGEICGARGYDILSSNGEQANFAMQQGNAGWNKSAGWANTSGFAGTMLTRNLVIACKGAEPAAAATQAQTQAVAQDVPPPSVEGTGVFRKRNTYPMGFNK